MSRVMIAWELGVGYGHASTFVALGRLLQERGCEVVVALRDPDGDGAMLHRAGLRCVAAPVWNRYRGVATRSHSYAAMLAKVGFLDTQHLPGVIDRWRALFQRFAPDLLIANHAPTALFASSGSNLKRVLYGTGFECPPRLDPFPPIDPNRDFSAERLLETEQRVLDCVNQVCNRSGFTPKQSVSDILAADAEFLCTFAELDPYRAHRDAVEYWGPQVDSRPTLLSRWRASVKRGAIFAYLRRDYARLSEAMAALQACGREVLVHCPGLPRKYVDQYTTRKLTFIAKPLDSGQMVSRFELVVSHAGHGTCLALLLEGRAHLMLPTNLEQEMNARAVAGEGAGRFVERENDAAPIEDALNAMLASDLETRAARVFARRYAGFSAPGQTRGIAGRIQRLLQD